MAWFINSAFNNGYPWNDEFPSDFLTSFTSEGVEIPYGSWRIKEGVNNGYPWIWYWFHEDAEIGTGDMHTGGTIDNYPNGFTTADVGGVSDQFDDDDMGYNTDIVNTVNGNLNIALSGKIMALSSSELFSIISYINNPSLIDNANRTLIQEIFGANIFDGVLICKQYPFDVSFGSLYRTVKPKIFGIVPIYDTESENSGYYPCPSPIAHFNMGTLSPDVLQAWEVEGIDFSIYLPYAGVFPLDIRDGSEIKVDLFIDLFTGSAEYYIKQNGQITDIHRTTIGMDFPLNFTQGQMSANGFGWGVSTASRLASPLLKSTSGLSSIGAMLTGAEDFAENNLTGKFAISAPQVGGSTGFASHPLTRIIAKIPKMFKGGYGFNETQGANRSTAFVRLDSCSGFTRCKNYKSNIANATSEEKTEIERLLNEGVFL